MDLGYSCSVTVATDSQSVIDHSRPRGHSVASKHVGLRGLWMEEAPEDQKLELDNVGTSMNPADVCTKALPGNRIRVCVGWPGCTYLEVKETWVTILLQGI